MSGGHAVFGVALPVRSPRRQRQRARSRNRCEAMSHRIIVAEDHPLLRHGLKALLGMHADYQVVDEAVDGREAVTKTLRLQPDLVLMDLSLPGTSGIDATAQIRRRLPQQKVLALSDYDSDIHVGEAMRAGCIGCLKKDCAPEEMMLAVWQRARARHQVCASMATSLAMVWRRRICARARRRRERTARARASSSALANRRAATSP